MKEESRRGNEDFAVIQERIHRFSHFGSNAGSAIEQELQLVQIPSDAACQLEYMAVDYGLKAAPSSAAVLTVAVCPATKDEALTNTEMVERSYWQFVQAYFPDGTPANSHVTNAHEESYLQEVIMVPRSVTDSGLYIYSHGWGAANSYYVLGLLEYSLLINQRYYSDYYTRQGRKYGPGWDGAWEELYA